MTNPSVTNKELTRQLDLELLIQGLDQLADDAEQLAPEFDVGAWDAVLVMGHLRRLSRVLRFHAGGLSKKAEHEREVLGIPEGRI